MWVLGYGVQFAVPFIIAFSLLFVGALAASILFETAHPRLLVGRSGWVACILSFAFLNLAKDEATISLKYKTLALCALGVSIVIIGIAGIVLSRRNVKSTDDH